MGSRSVLTRMRTSPLPFGGRVCVNPRRAWGASPLPLVYTSQVACGNRYATLEAGENKSGHISAGPNEGILFFGNVFPLKLQWLLRLPLPPEKSLSTLLKGAKIPVAAADPKKIVQKANKNGAELSVLDILPRLKEGGTFVKFSHREGLSAAEVEASLQKYLVKKPLKPWWSPFQRVRASLVRGNPWVEDLYRLPSTRLKVEFLPAEPGAEAAELSQEQLYTLFRPYGRLSQITPQPTDSKAIPKFATLDFLKVRRSVMAKNCMHGYKVLGPESGSKAGAILRLTYEPKVKGHWIRDWLFSHPRIVIPALAALIATLTVAIFDPIRTFFVKTHVTRVFHLSDNKIYRWFVAKKDDILAFRGKADERPGVGAIFEDRKEHIEQIQKWLMETDDTFIIVQGPRGSGKDDMVIEQALKDWKHKLIMDCKPIHEARGEGGIIRAAASQVGYTPVFSWMNSISGMIDMAAQGTAGVKTGFSETLETQLVKIMTTTATALKKIALESRKHDTRDENLNDDEYLDAHPEVRPVVVINNFMHKSQDSSIVYDKLAEWAASVTTGNIAHVIFLTSDISYYKPLSKALPDRVFHQISLSDCAPDVAKRFVLSHFDHETATNASAQPASSSSSEDSGDAEKPHTEQASQATNDLSGLDECIAQLGGRLTDLEFLARRIQTGEAPRKAVAEIVEQSASEILKMYLSFDSSSSSKSTTTTTSSSSTTTQKQRGWSPEQAWLLIKQLAAHQTLRYHELLLDDLFKGGAGEAALAALEQAELISIAASPRASHRLARIAPGRPVFLPAFRQLADDRVLRARLDLAVLAARTAVESRTVEACESELNLLATLPKQPGELVPRVQWVLAKAAASQAKIEAFERESTALKKVLSTED